MAAAFGESRCCTGKPEGPDSAKSMPHGRPFSGIRCRINGPSGRSDAAYIVPGQHRCKPRPRFRGAEADPEIRADPSLGGRLKGVKPRSQQRRSSCAERTTRLQPTTGGPPNQRCACDSNPRPDSTIIFGPSGAAVSRATSVASEPVLEEPDLRSAVEGRFPRAPGNDLETLSLPVTSRGLA